MRMLLDIIKEISLQLIAIWCTQIIKSSNKSSQLHFLDNKE